MRLMRVQTGEEYRIGITDFYIIKTHYCGTPSWEIAERIDGSYHLECGPFFRTLKAAKAYFEQTVLKRMPNAKDL